MLTRSDLLAALERDDEVEPTALDAGSSPPIVTYPDALLEEALDTMVGQETGRLPVAHRNEPTRLIGLLGRSGIAAAYETVLETAPPSLDC
jgi:CBS domain-containing protein